MNFGELYGVVVLRSMDVALGCVCGGDLVNSYYVFDVDGVQLRDPTLTPAPGQTIFFNLTIAETATFYNPFGLARDWTGGPIAMGLYTIDNCAESDTYPNSYKKVDERKGPCLLGYDIPSYTPDGFTFYYRSGANPTSMNGTIVVTRPAVAPTTSSPTTPVPTPSSSSSSSSSSTSSSVSSSSSSSTGVAPGSNNEAAAVVATGPLALVTTIIIMITGCIHAFS